MTKVDELRRLLDERGVEHYDRIDVTEWVGADYEICHTNAVYSNGASVLVLRKCTTPERAIAATLGRGTCWLHDCDGSFSSVNRPVWRCDCGAFMTQYTDATTYHKPRYCPNCGRRCVG